MNYQVTYENPERPGEVEERFFATRDELVMALGSDYKPGFRLLTVQENQRKINDGAFEEIVIDMALVYLRYSVGSQLKIPSGEAGLRFNRIMAARLKSGALEMGNA